MIFSIIFIQELRLIPIEDDKELHERSISAIYDALCKGAELNPG